MPDQQYGKPLEQQWKVNAGEYVTAMEWSPKGDLLAVATADGTILLLDAKTGATTLELPGHPLGTLSLSWSRTGKYLASGGQDKWARLYDSATADELARLEGGSAWVEQVAWAPAADILATVSGKHLKLWNSDGLQQRAFPPAAHAIATARWDIGGARLAAVGFGGITIWDAHREEQVRLYENQLSLISAAWSPGSEHLICGTQDATMLIWNVKTGADLLAGPYEGKVRELAWHHRGRYLATGGGREISIWDFKVPDLAGAQPRFLSGHTALLSALSFQRRGNLLASGAIDGTTLVWSFERSDYPLAAGRTGDEISGLSWHPGDHWFATGHASGDVYLWSI